MPVHGAPRRLRVGYFGVNAGESYWRFFQYRDAMEQEAKFARPEDQRPDSHSVAGGGRLAGPPEEAGMISDSSHSGLDIDRGRTTTNTSRCRCTSRPSHYRPRAVGPL